MAIQVTTTRAISVSNGVKCAIYGKSGMGKTKMLATAPYPIILSAERGTLSLRNYDIPVIQIENIGDMWEAHRYLTTSAEGQQFQTICLDSASEIAEQVLSNAKTLNAKDPRQAYGALGEEMVVALKAFRDIPYRNVVLTAKQGPTKDDLTGITTYSAQFPGKVLNQAFPYLFDEVFQLGMLKQVDATGVMQDYRVLRTKADMQYDAKDRSGALPPMIQVPDMPDGVNTGFLTWIFNEINKPAQQ